MISGTLDAMFDGDAEVIGLHGLNARALVPRGQVDAPVRRATD